MCGGGGGRKGNTGEGINRGGEGGEEKERGR